MKLKPAPLKKPDVPLRTTAPVYDPQVASAVYARTMDSQITITQRELLSLLPEVRNQVHEATSNRRIIRMETPLVPVEQNLLDVFAHIEITDNEDDPPSCGKPTVQSIGAGLSVAWGMST